jgi:hypothetical protein
MDCIVTFCASAVRMVRWFFAVKQGKYVNDNGKTPDVRHLIS